MKYCLMIGVSIFLFILGCKKPTDNACPTLPGSTSPLGYNFKIDSPFLKFPYFNPNNSNELLFVEEFPSSKLFTYNLITGAKNLIFEGNIISPPKWSRTDWILLNLSDASIWKIKSNGDSLTQLTYTGSNYYGEWDAYGQRFIFSRTVGSSYYTLIANNLGVVVDTLSQWTISSHASWQNPTYLTFVDYLNGIILLDSSNVAKTLYSIDKSEVDGIFFCNKCTDVVWCSRNKIYSTDIYSMNTILLHSSCLSTYLFPSFNGTHILVQKVEHAYLGNNVVQVTSTLVLVNKSSSVEHELNL